MRADGAHPRRLWQPFAHEGCLVGVTVLKSLTGLTGATSLARRKDLLEQSIIKLVKHSVAEEAAGYPEMAKKSEKDEADRRIREQSEAEVTMKQFEALHPGDAEYETKLASLMEQIHAHVLEEEDKAFPLMRASLAHDEPVAMAGKVTTVKTVAPTRPHPSAPDTPPGNLLLGP